MLVCVLHARGRAAVPAEPSARRVGVCVVVSKGFVDKDLVFRGEPMLTSKHQHTVCLHGLYSVCEGVRAGYVCMCRTGRNVE